MFSIPPLFAKGWKLTACVFSPPSLTCKLEPPLPLPTRLAAVLELYSGFQRPGFRIPSRNFADSLTWSYMGLENREFTKLLHVIHELLVDILERGNNYVEKSDDNGLALLHADQSIVKRLFLSIPNLSWSWRWNQTKKKIPCMQAAYVSWR